MGRVKGGAVTTLRPCEKQCLRAHIKAATATGRTSFTTDELVSRLCSTFPQSYAGRNLKLLTERVAEYTPRCRLPQPKKRRKTAKTPIVNIVSEEGESSDSEGTSKDVNESNPPISGDLGQSDELGDGGRGEMSKNGDDVNGDNQPVSGGLGRSDGLGRVWREINKNGDDVNGNNRPMFRDLGGMHSVINDLKWEVIVPRHQLEILHHLGVEPTARILLHGPPGCGKTTLARALANEAGLPLFEVSAADLVSGVYGASEENIRELFSTAYMREPSIVFIDEIDAMTSKTENLQKEIEPRILNLLMAFMDEPNRLIKPVNHGAGSKSSNNRPGYVLVIGATNRPDALDPALRRRFDREIVVDVPEIIARRDILSFLTRNLKVEDGFNHHNIARCLFGFVGGDLAALVKKAGICALKRITDMRKYTQKDMFQFENYYRKPFSNEEMKNVSLTVKDFVEAAGMVQPSSRLEGFSTTPNANWDDVGGLHLLKLEFERHVVKRIKSPEVYKEFYHHVVRHIRSPEFCEDLGVNIRTTFFLYGSSGCGKTLIVEALANEAGANFLHIKGTKLKNYHDQSELVMRIILNYARAHPPCILFFDELEAIIPDGDEVSDFEQLIIELVEEETSGVHVIVATNRPKVVSHLNCSSLEKFDMILHVPLPSPAERGAILKALARNNPIDAHVDLMALGKDVACENFSGADLSEMMTEAVKTALDRQTLSGGGCRVPWTIKDADLKGAVAKISPSVSSKEVEDWKDVPARCEADWEWS